LKDFLGTVLAFAIVVIVPLYLVDKYFDNKLVEQPQPPKELINYILNLDDINGSAGVERRFQNTDLTYKILIPNTKGKYENGKNMLSYFIFISNIYGENTHFPFNAGGFNLIIKTDKFELKEYIPVSKFDAETDDATGKIIYSYIGFLKSKNLPSSLYGKNLYINNLFLY
jgi:hypothetical protein|tara:strand:+ start:396 stop:905 length:510 start_codon:yes stop_codon:yes gene_type:complete